MVYRLFHYLQGFHHPRWCKISSIHRIPTYSNGLLPRICLQRFFLSWPVLPNICQSLCRKSPETPATLQRIPGWSENIWHHLSALASLNTTFTTCRGTVPLYPVAGRVSFLVLQRHGRQQYITQSMWRSPAWGSTFAAGTDAIMPCPRHGLELVRDGTKHC